MKIIVPVKRVVDYNVKVHVKAEDSGVIVVEGTTHLEEKGILRRLP